MALEKFVCPFETCKHRYSSKIARNLHMRKMHEREDPATSKE